MAKSITEKRKDALFRLERRLELDKVLLKETQAKKPAQFDSMAGGAFLWGDGSKRQEEAIKRITRSITLGEQEIAHIKAKL